MKVEYSYFFDAPSLIIKGTDFIKALKDREESYLLEIAVEGFTAKFDVDSHFNEDANEELLKWVSKTSEIIYTIKERWVGNSLLDSWCEVYVSDGGRPKAIIFSENHGRNYELRRKETADNE